MPWEVAFDDANGIVQVTVRGPASHDEHVAAREEAARVCLKAQSRKLLVDLRDLETERVVSTSGCFEFGDRFTLEGGIPPGTRIAHILPRDPKACEDVEFTTAVARNRGAAIRNFEDQEDARNWLLGR